MIALYNAADSTGVGYISREAFLGILQSQKMRTWLSAQDVEVGDGLLLFDLMDDGDDRLTAAELVRGMARMKGPARSLDVIGLMHMTSHLSSEVSKMDAKINAKLKPPKPTELEAPQFGA